MKKHLKIIAAATAVLLTLGAAGCSKNSQYPDFINPTEQEGPIVNGEKYVINVQSEGGMQLDGVRVSAVRNGQVIKRGISIDGKIELGVALGEYDLVVDETSLPAGYHMPDTTYKTNASSREPVTIKISSSVIAANSSVEATYALGTIMKDFTFVDCRGSRWTLSDLLKVKKAVALNFWYSGCGPCRAEFPHIQRAYANRNDVEFLAICSTHQGDTNTIVENYKTENGLAFPMGIDTLGLNSAFGVNSFPTTVVIDRYGLIAYRSTGTEPTTAFWTGLFNDFASDSYTQKLSTSVDPNPGNPEEPSRVKPTYTMPASAALEAQANGARLNATYRADEDEFSWPWLAGDGYIYSSNTRIGNSYSILYADIDIKKDEVLSFEYNVSSEEGHDLLYVMIDGTRVNGDGWSATDGWQSADIYVADRNKSIELAFVYRKDDADLDDNTDEDVAKIRNIHISDVSALKKPIDVMREAASGEVINFRYENYVTPVYNPDDGFYHVGTADGALLYITLNQLTPWSELHTGSVTESGSTTYYNTLYYMTYYRYATKGENFSVNLGGVNLTDTVTDFWSIQGYMDAPNYLVPVTEDLKIWAQKFVERFERDSDVQSHENEWLEFCYYYDHYGNGHTEGERCPKYDDPTRGLTKNNCYFAYEKTDSRLASSETKGTKSGRNKALISFPLQRENGMYYEFTAKGAGVYQIRSYTLDCSSTGSSPGLVIYDENDRRIGSSDDVRDFDQFTDGIFTGNSVLDDGLTDKAYQGFNHYITLDAGETVYLKLTDAPETTGYYEFEISYLGASHDTMLIATTGGGMWGGSRGERYIGVNYELVDGYYYVADSRGNADLSKPLYIDFTHGSYLYSNLADYNFAPLKDIVDDRVFSNRDYNIMFGDQIQAEMEAYLGQAVDKNVNDPYYGMVHADVTLVENLNTYIDYFIEGGRGEGNGWLAWACYMEHFGA